MMQVFVLSVQNAVPAGGDRLGDRADAVRAADGRDARRDGDGRDRQPRPAARRRRGARLGSIHRLPRAARVALAACDSPGVPRRRGRCGVVWVIAVVCVKEQPLRRSLDEVSAADAAAGTPATGGARLRAMSAGLHAARRLGPRRAVGREREAGRVLLRAARSASTARRTRGPRPGVRDRASYVLEQGEIRLVVSSALRPGHEIGDHALRARRRREGHRAARSRRRRGVPRGSRARRAGRRRAARRRGRVRQGRARHDRDLRRRRAHVRHRNAYEGAYLPGYVAQESANGTGDGVGLLAIDHIVGNVELGRMERVGRVLRARLRDDRDDPLLRRRHLDRVLGADVEGDDGRAGEGQVPDQRAGRGQAQEPDRRVPRVQRGPGRAAHRDAVVEHRQDGRGACSAAA